MNVLFLAPFPPLPEISGSRMRAMTLLRSLSAHQVFIVAFCGPDEPIDLALLRKSFAGVYIFSPPQVGFFKKLFNHFSLKPLLSKRFFLEKAREKVRQLVVEKKIDLVISETLIMAEYLRGLSVPWRILDEHNLEYIRAERRIHTTHNGLKKIYDYLIMRRLRHYERKALAAADICLACSAEDAAKIGRLCSAKRIWVSPNTVDTEYFQPGPTAWDPRRIVFTGTMWYEPNVDAMRFFCREILPLIRKKITDATLVIAGDKPTDDMLKLGQEKGIIVTGYVADIRPILAEAAVFVAPLRMGGGTRLKILGAMAMGVPVVSTAIGAEGIAALDGMTIRIADNPLDFAAAVLDILADPFLRQRLSAGGRELVLENYSSLAIDRQLRLLWREIGQKKKAPCVN